MSASAVFGIYGDSDSGKTTLIVDLVSQLVQEGYRVATVKQTSKAISMDTLTKDTWRYHDAGASLVVFSSSCETDFLVHKKMDAVQIIQRIGDFGVFDIILIEGATEPTIPKIQIGTRRKRVNTLAQYNGNVQEIVTLIKKGMTKTSTPHLRVIINGKQVPVSEFPEQIITRTIVAMLGSLKGVQDIKEVNIQLKQKKNRMVDD